MAHITVGFLRKLNLPVFKGKQLQVLLLNHNKIVCQIKTHVLTCIQNSSVGKLLLNRRSSQIMSFFFYPEKDFPLKIVKIKALWFSSDIVAFHTISVKIQTYLMCNQTCPLRSKLENLAAFSCRKRRSRWVRLCRTLGLGPLFLASHFLFTKSESFTCHF